MTLPSGQTGVYANTSTNPNVQLTTNTSTTVPYGATGTSGYYQQSGNYAGTTAGTAGTVAYNSGSGYYNPPSGVRQEVKQTVTTTSPNYTSQSTYK